MQSLHSLSKIQFSQNYSQNTTREIVAKTRTNVVQLPIVKGPKTVASWVHFAIVLALAEEGNGR